MKTYKCHKVVEAAKIVATAKTYENDGALLKCDDNTTHAVEHGWLVKNGRTPADLIGGYFVRYGDGYTSWSPAAAFEEGYAEHSLDPKDGALPVAGYKPQTEEKVRAVNVMKEAEERVLRALDAQKGSDEVDQRWLALGRTHLELAFMAINRAVFQPGRVTLPEDAAA